jgi:hypothetical protein
VPQRGGGTSMNQPAREEIGTGHHKYHEQLAPRGGIAKSWLYGLRRACDWQQTGLRWRFWLLEWVR